MVIVHSYLGPRRLQLVQHPYKVIPLLWQQMIQFGSTSFSIPFHFYQSMDEKT
jgi:hypothetical protein